MGFSKQSNKQQFIFSLANNVDQVNNNKWF